MTDRFLHPTDVLENVALESGWTVADFGTGQGRFAVALARAVGPAGRVYAIDVMPRMVSKVAREAQRLGLQNVYAQKGDLEKPGGSSLRDTSVHAVFIVNVLFQAQEPKVVLQEAFRVLRSGGQCVVVDWSTTRSAKGEFGPAKEHRVSPDVIEKAAEAVGFVVDREIAAGTHHFGVIFKKS